MNQLGLEQGNISLQGFNSADELVLSYKNNPETMWGGTDILFENNSFLLTTFKQFYSILQTTNDRRTH